MPLATGARKVLRGLMRFPAMGGQAVSGRAIARPETAEVGTRTLS
jgi:hypothetical protein